MEIVREAADGVSTSVLAQRFGVTPRAVQYTVKSDAERQKANRAGQGSGLEFSELRLMQMRGLARFILDSADEIDLLVRRRRDAMQLDATAALREFAHAAE
mgnify:CR=1 FL=1